MQRSQQPQAPATLHFSRHPHQQRRVHQHHHRAASYHSPSTPSSPSSPAPSSSGSSLSPAADRVGELSKLTNSLNISDLRLGHQLSERLADLSSGSEESERKAARKMLVAPAGEHFEAPEEPRQPSEPRPSAGAQQGSSPPSSANSSSNANAPTYYAHPDASHLQQQQSHASYHHYYASPVYAFQLPSQEHQRQGENSSALEYLGQQESNNNNSDVGHYRSNLTVSLSADHSRLQVPNYEHKEQNYTGHFAAAAVPAAAPTSNLVDFYPIHECHSTASPPELALARHYGGQQGLHPQQAQEGAISELKPLVRPPSELFEASLTNWPGEAAVGHEHLELGAQVAQSGALMDAPAHLILGHQHQSPQMVNAPACRQDNGHQLADGSQHPLQQARLQVASGGHFNDHLNSHHHHHHNHHLQASASEPELKVCEWEACEHTFLDMGEFVKHLEERHVNQGPREKNRFFCLWARCKRNEQEFNARYKLLIHMRVHSGEKPYPCDNANCNKSFSRLENLKIHQRSHTGEKPYKCSFKNCPKSFTNSSDRIKHHKTHRDPKPYSCSFNACTKRYTDPSSLRKHLRAHKRAQEMAGRDQQSGQAPGPQERQPQEEPQRGACAADFDPRALLSEDPRHHDSPFSLACAPGSSDSHSHGFLASGSSGVGGYDLAVYDHDHHHHHHHHQQQQQQQQEQERRHGQYSRSWCVYSNPRCDAPSTSSWAGECGGASGPQGWWPGASASDVSSNTGADSFLAQAQAQAQGSSQVPVTARQHEALMRSLPAPSSQACLQLGCCRQQQHAAR